MEEDRLERHVALMRGKRITNWILVGKPEGKRPPGRPTPRWEDNIKINLKGVGWVCEMDWAGSGQGQVAG